MNFYRDIGRKVNCARQPTSSEGKVKHETFLEMHTVGGKDTFVGQDNVGASGTALWGPYPLLVSLMLSETETVVEQDEHPASHVPNLDAHVL